MKRFIILVIDSFGIGAMADVVTERPQDLNANTYKSTLLGSKISLPNMEKLGIANAANFETENIKFSSSANYGKSNLKHFGCDTFYGHQELMGTLPKKPTIEPFCNCIDDVENELMKKGYKVERYGEREKVLIINECATVGDNLEADLGQVYNITGTLDLISYDELLKIGKIVREIVKVPRVITFGGENVTLDDIKKAYEFKKPNFAGINAPKSGVYNKGYKVQHMGYGVDEKVQLPTIIGDKIKTVLIGKVADIVKNEFGESIPIVDTREVMECLIKKIEENETSFICANVQETDLAGHQENKVKYQEKLVVVDKYLPEILSKLDEEDIFILTADHGNDPSIGHSNHTREQVPVLIYNNKMSKIEIGELASLADIGQSAAEYFGYKLPDNGVSFLKELKPNK
ncbi:MAG: phosphopentomutase [Fusobacteriaceae bacterium]